MTCLTALCIVRRVEVSASGKLGSDYVTVGLLRNGLNGTQRAHWRLVSESMPLTEREARRKIEDRTSC